MYVKVGDESHDEEGLSVMNGGRECKGDFEFAAGAPGRSPAPDAKIT
jgi:hypothetical protein